MMRIAKHFDAVGPNPWVVRLALAYKGLEVPTRRLKLTDDGKPENRADAEVTKLNPAATTPFFLLEDGTVLSESIAMVKYLDQLHPNTPSLTGDLNCEKDQAMKHMWQRRVELQIIAPYQRQYQYGEGISYFKDYVPWAEVSSPGVPGLRAQIVSQLQWLEENCFHGSGDHFIAGGDQMSVADLQLYTTAAFMGKVNKAKLFESFDPFAKGDLVEKELPKLKAWNERMSSFVKGLGKKGR
eukprot:g2303.t1